MSNEPYRPRLAAELRPDQHARLIEIIPRGMQKPLFQALVDGILELYDRGGMQALSAIVGKYLDVNQVAGIGLQYKGRQNGNNLPPK